MEGFNLERFKSEVLSKGLARPNRFHVIINTPPGIIAPYSGYNNLVSLFCEETNFPPLIATAKAYRIYGPSFQMPISAEYGGEGISMTFYVDREMKVKRFFEEWIHTIVEQDTFLLNYRNNYSTDSIIIHQLDEKDETTYTCKLIDAFPRSINLMPLNNSLQNQVHRLTVMFAYRYWESVVKPRLSPIQPTSESVVLPSPVRPSSSSIVLPETQRRQFDWLTGEYRENIQGSDFPPAA